MDMVYTIALDNVPSQTLGVTIAGASYILRLRDVEGQLTADVEINGARVISGVSCLPNQKILPYPYLTKGGNFYFWCTNNELPNYTKFGGDHRLLFLTDDEIERLPAMKDL